MTVARLSGNLFRRERAGRGGRQIDFAGTLR